MGDLPEWVGIRPPSLHVKSCSVCWPPNRYFDRRTIDDFKTAPQLSEQVHVYLRLELYTRNKATEGLCSWRSSLPLRTEFNMESNLLDKMSITLDSVTITIATSTDGATTCLV